MDHITVDRKTGRIHLVKCESGVPSGRIDIEGKCFLLLVLTDGEASFSVGGKKHIVSAPAFVCFDESDDPVIKAVSGDNNFMVFFHPAFLNVNMTFGLIRSDGYERLAYDYDLFLCKPFLQGCRNIPIPISMLSAVKKSCSDMLYELSEQRDSYWSCRARSCFIETIVLLERAHRLSSGHDLYAASDKYSITDKAVEFIEGNFNRRISYDDIIKASGTNRNTLSVLFRERFGMTSFEYLNAFRIEIAKKQIEFTNVPLKDIAARCGFKTVQHFSRIFKRLVGETPASFRKRTLDERKRELNNKDGEK